MYHTSFLPYQNLFCEYFESRQKHDMCVMQYHDTYEIYLQTKGERYLFLNGLCHVLKPMDLYIVKPFKMHYCQSMSSDYYGRYVTNFSDNMLLPLLTPTEHRLLMSKLSTGVFHLDEAHYNRICNIFQELLHCCSHDGFLSEKIKATLILQLLLIIRECHKDEYIQEGKQEEIQPEIITAIEYINSHYQEPLQLDQVAQQIHMSKYYFCRQFKETVGATFVEYVNSIRMAKVHQLLLESSLSLSEISQQTGFSSGIHLTRVFRSFYQVTPSEFRKQHKNM